MFQLLQYNVYGVYAASNAFSGFHPPGSIPVKPVYPPTSPPPPTLDFAHLCPRPDWAEAPAEEEEDGRASSSKPLRKGSQMPKYPPGLPSEVSASLQESLLIIAAITPFLCLHWDSLIFPLTPLCPQLLTVRHNLSPAAKNFKCHLRIFL